MDSGFILELFCRYYRRNWPEDDVCLSTPWLQGSIRIDLLLLENQLPFFVLDRLFNLSFTSDEVNRISFLDLTFDYFGYYNRSELKFNNISISHFTDLIRIFHLPEKKSPREQNKVMKHIPSATELSEAGAKIKVKKVKSESAIESSEAAKIKVKSESATELSEAIAKIKVKSESKCLLDLTFSRGVLQIPQLIVDDWTEILFRNMLALEMCHYPSQSWIADYVTVMDFLVNTSKDVEILVQEGVLHNLLGDNDSAANLFNGLMKNVVRSNTSSTYIQLEKDLNVFHKRTWNKLMFALRHDYFKTPWQTVVSFAGFFLLVLSLVQTVCSVLQVK